MRGAAMRVTVRLHGEVSKYLQNGKDTTEIETADGTTVQAILEELGLPSREFVLLAVNGSAVSPDTPLRPGDILECVAPMSGG
jgi:sulfur carrier protein ThiS